MKKNAIKFLRFDSFILISSYIYFQIVYAYFQFVYACFQIVYACFQTAKRPSRFFKAAFIVEDVLLNVTRILAENRKEKVGYFFAVGKRSAEIFFV